MKREGEIKRGRLVSTESYFRVRRGPGRGLDRTAQQAKTIWKEIRTLFLSRFTQSVKGCLRGLKATSSLFASFAPFICRLHRQPRGSRSDTELNSPQDHTVTDGFHSRTAHFTQDNIPHSIRYAEASKNYNNWTKLLESLDSDQSAVPV